MTDTAPSALITGASRGIGRAIALRLAARRHRLTVVARRSDGLAAVAEELGAAGAPEVATCAADLSDAEGAARPLAVHAERFGDLDVLVLNAGMGDRGAVTDYPLRRFERIHAVNVRAPFVMLQAATPLLRAAAARNPERGAKVVALASSTGVYPEPEYGAYGASKAALISLVKSYGLEEAGNGITATTLSPGYVGTDMTDWLPAEMADTLLDAEDVATMVEAAVLLGPNAALDDVTLLRRGSGGNRA